MRDSSKKKRILIFTTVPETIRAFLLPQIADLQDHGYEVHVATGFQGCSLPELTTSGVTEYRLHLIRNISPLQDIKALWAAIKILRCNNFDIVHTHTLKASLIGQLAARFTNVPVRVETAHGTRYMPDLPFAVQKGIILSEQLAAKKAHRVWVLNQEDFDFFLSKGLAQKEALQLLSRGGIGADLSRFRPALFDPLQREDYRCKLQLPKHGPVVGFVGRLVQDKGIRELLAAWPEVLRQFPKAFLLIVTAHLESERKAELISQQQLKQMHNTVLLTNRSDMEKLFNCMDMLVLPSYREGFSRVIIEASACGLPVIASDVRGCRDGVVHGQTGLLTPPGNAGCLAQAIVELLSDWPRLTAMGKQARLLAEKNFDQNIIIKNIRLEYERLLSMHGKHIAH